MIKVVQLEEDEWNLLETLLDVAHKIRVRSEAGEYKGALKSPKEEPAAKELAADFMALTAAAKAARPASY